MKNKTISVLLTLAVILSVVQLGTVTVRAANVGDTFTQTNQYSVGSTFTQTDKYGVEIKFQITDDVNLTVAIVADNYSGKIEIPWRVSVDGTHSYTVTAIGNEAFLNCSSLTAVTIPSSVTSIGDDAFGGTGQLTNLVIPQSVSTIGTKAFESSAVNNLEIPYGVKTIKDETFESSKLEHITILDGVTDIGENAFAGCFHLEDVILPTTLKTIGRSAFASCEGLKKITIPSSVDAIGAYAFEGCNWLGSVYFDGKEPSFTGTGAFDTGAIVNGASTKIYCSTANAGTFSDDSYKNILNAVATKCVIVSGTQHGTVTASTVDGIEGETIMVKAAPDSGYTLKHLIYTPGVEATGGSGFIMPNSDVTVSATFETACTVTFDKNNSMACDASPASEKTFGSGTVALPVNPNSFGMTFVGWKDAQGADFTAPTPVTGDITVYAQWKYPMTALPSVGGKISSSDGQISPSGGTILVAPNENRTFTATADMGYELTHFNVDGSDVAGNTYTFTNITSYHILRATFEKTYMITSSANAGGSISPSGTTYVSEGSDQSFAITPDSGYVISDVKVDDVSKGVVSSYSFTNITANHTISATFSSCGTGGGVYIPQSYSLTASAGAGGSISPVGSTSVISGGSETYSITPADGYEIKDVSVDGVSVGAVGTYTFSNVQAAHVITASFAAKAPVNSFADVKDGDWFHDSVVYVSEKGLMTGVSQNIFSPNGTLTRGMMVTVLYRLSGDTGSYTNSFSDVAPDSWYEKAVAWAAAKGIVSGVGDGLFSPESDISREQLAVMLYNYAKSIGKLSNSEGMSVREFSDYSSISDWALASIQWAQNNGIISGTGTGFAPKSDATRAEAAKMITLLATKTAK